MSSRHPNSCGRVAFAPGRALGEDGVSKSGRVCVEGCRAAKLPWILAQSFLMQGLVARKLELEGDGLSATREMRLNSRGSKRVRRAARIDYKSGDVESQGLDNCQRLAVGLSSTRRKQ